MHGKHPLQQSCWENGPIWSAALTTSFLTVLPGTGEEHNRLYQPIKTGYAWHLAPDVRLSSARLTYCLQQPLAIKQKAISGSGGDAPCKAACLSSWAHNLCLKMGTEWHVKQQKARNGATVLGFWFIEFGMLPCTKTWSSKDIDSIFCIFSSTVKTSWIMIMFSVENCLIRLTMPSDARKCHFWVLHVRHCIIYYTASKYTLVYKDKHYRFERTVA